MRWYFAIDEHGGAGETGTLARLAVLSALAIGGLEPVLLYYGGKTSFTDWMDAQGVRIIESRPPLLEAMRAAQGAGTFRPHSIGHWLRLGIPQVERDHEYVLYTDCDVVFLRPFDWAALRPPVLAAAPEGRPDDWRYFNSGVMLLNVPAMRASYQGFEDHVKIRLGRQGFFNYDDQIALNEAYGDFWQRLDPLCNWKPYWDLNKRAAILHLHGPKLNALEAIAARRWHDQDPAAILYEKLMRFRSSQYLAWCQWLGDFLQSVDLPSAIRFATLASSLTRYRRDHPPDPDPDSGLRALFP